MKKSVFIALLLLCLTLAGCGGGASDSAAQEGADSQSPATEEADSQTSATEEVDGQTSATEEVDGETSATEEVDGETSATEKVDGQTSATEEVDGQTSATEETSAPQQTEGEQTATLYIGTKAEGFTEYPMPYGGTLEPDALIEGIGRLTGWDMSLEEPVISGKGGMSVCFSENCALFAGPPEEQKEEFHMYDVGQLAETLLDSVQKTLQENYTLEGGDPDALDIWYFLKDDQPLSIPNLGLTWAIDQPYQWASAVQE